MSTRKTTLFYVLLTAVASFAVALVIASRLDLTPASSAQPIVAPASNSAPIGGAIDALTFRNIAKAQSQVVVNIRTEMKAKAQDLSDFFGGGGGAPDDLFRRFFGPGGGGGGGGQDDQDDTPSNKGRRPRGQKTQAAGTGFIISKDGFILTNNHVVEDATKIEVQFLGDEDDDMYTAKVVGKDALTDSALIQLTEMPKHPLTEAKFGDSSQMAPGDWVVAIGNPFGYAHTVTVGVISAIGRPFQAIPGRTNEMIQTDAAINPGNSGGPLLNIRGEVIGVNTAIISNERTAGNIGIGFAVPINAVRDLLPQLRQGKIVRGRIGVEVGPVPRDG
jgi:serine protease Do